MNLVLDHLARAGAALRGTWRLARVALHLAWAVLLAGIAFPLLPPDRRRRLRQRWSRQLLAMLGLRLRVAGDAPQPGEMVVANHVSWLDVYAINAVAPCAFVAKDDVRDWPLIGWLCRRTETIFIARGSARAAHAVRAEIAERLAAGVSVAAFPEGTTTDGRGVLPFHGALLQGALDAGAPVRPLALRYRHGADASVAADAPAYCGDTSLLESLWRIACAPALTAEVAVLPTLGGSDADRRRLATTARGMIAVAVEHGWHGPHGKRPVGAAAGAPTAGWSPQACSITSSPG